MSFLGKRQTREGASPGGRNEEIGFKREGQIFAEPGVMIRAWISILSEMRNLEGFEQWTVMM